MTPTMILKYKSMTPTMILKYKSITPTMILKYKSMTPTMILKYKSMTPTMILKYKSMTPTMILKYKRNVIVIIDPGDHDYYFNRTTYVLFEQLALTHTHTKCSVCNLMSHQCIRKSTRHSNH